MNDKTNLHYAPFPAACLPEPVCMFIRSAARSICTDPAMVALPTIAALGACVGNSRRLLIRKTWKEPCVFWLATVAGSGDGKTPAFREAIRPLSKMQVNAAREYEELLTIHESDIAQWEMKHKEWKKRNRDPEHEPAKPTQPVCKRLLIQDTTMEAVLPILADNPRGVLVANDELSGWLKSTNAYRGGKGGDIERWLEMWSCGTIVKDREKYKGKPLVVDPASASICGTIQPSILHDVLGRNLIDNGFAPRLLLAAPPRKKITWTDAEIGDETQQRMERLYQALSALSMNYDISGNAFSVDVPFDDHGREAWIEFYNAHEERKAAMLDDERAVASKMTAYCARFALLHYLIRVCTQKTDANAVDAESVACAIQLTRWFHAETERVYLQIGENETEHAMRELVEVVQARGGSITVQELKQSNRRYHKADHARSELKAMEDAGYGKLTFKKQNPKGGRPSEYFMLHPDLMTDEQRSAWMDNQAPKNGEFAEGCTPETSIPAA